MNNLHITLNELKNASRVIKETTSILNETAINKVYVAALHGDNQKKNEVVNNVEIKRFSLTSRRLGKSLIFQILKYFEYIIRIILFYFNKNIKIVNVHTVGLLPLGVFLKYFYGAKLVYDAHELETEVNGLKGIRKSLSKLIERLFIQKVDLVIVVSESISQWYVNNYSIPRPIVVLNSPKLINREPTNLLRERLSIPMDCKIILYQGGLEKGRGIELILDAMSKNQRNDIAFVFMGYGTLENKIKYYSNNFEHIYFHEAVDPADILDYTSSADLGVSLIENTCLSYYYCLPNKLFEYTMAGLPIIVSNMKEMAAIVNKFSAGSVMVENSAEELNFKINYLINSDLTELKTNAKRLATENCWSIQEEKMIESYIKLGFRK